MYDLIDTTAVAMCSVSVAMFVYEELLRVVLVSDSLMQPVSSLDSFLVLMSKDGVAVL